MILNEFSSWQFKGSFEDFYKKSLKKNDEFKRTKIQPKQSFIIKDGFRILSDAITHVQQGHALTTEQWDIVIKLLNEGKIDQEELSLSPRQNGDPVKLYKLNDGNNLYGITVEYFKKKLPFITTAFVGTEGEIKHWFKCNSDHIQKIRARQGDGNTPSVTTKGLLLGRDSNNIISENNKKVNRYFNKNINEVCMNIKSINEKLDKFLNEGIQGEDVELVVVLRKLISEENDAVSSYNEKVKYLEELGYVDEAKVLLDIASEELVHIGELEALLMKNGISADIQTMNGIEEVNDKLGEEIN